MNRSAQESVGPRLPPLFALLAVAMLVKGLLWSYAIPPFDAPDEPAHYSHAQLIALRGRVPTFGPLEGTSPDVDRLTFAVLVPVTPGSPRARLYQERGGQGAVGAAEASAARASQQPTSQTPSGFYGPVAYLLYAVPVRLLSAQGIVAQLQGARMVAVLLGTAAVLAVAWAGLVAGLDSRMAVAAGMIAGYQPMWSQQTAVVNADSALFFFASLFFALALGWLRRPRPGLGLAAAGALALTLLCKPAGLFALPFAVVFLVPAIRLRGSARLRAIGVAVALCLLAVVPFLAWDRYRPAGTAAATDRGTLRQYLHLLRDGGFAYPRGVLGQFWGSFGWLEQNLSPGTITALRVATAIAAVVCLVALARRAPGWPAILLGLAYFVACAGVAFGYDLLLWLNQHTLGVQGRYLLPALGGAAVALVLAIDGLLPRRAAHLLVGALATAMVLLNVASLTVLGNRFLVT